MPIPDPFSVSHPLHPDAQAIIDRRPHWLVRNVLYAVLAGVSGAVAWACFAHVDRVVVAQGRLITTEPIVVVQPFEIGVIRSIDAAVGMRVRQGQILMTLDPTSAESAVEELSYRKGLLEAEVLRLSAEADDRAMAEGGSDPTYQSQRQLAAQRRAEYQARLADYAAGINRLDGQRAAAVSRQQIIKGRLDIARELEATRQQLQLKEAGTRLSVLGARSERLSLEEQLSTAVAEASDCLRQAEKLRAEIDAFAQNWRREVLQRLVDVRRELEAVAQQHTVASKRSELSLLRAPVDGVVLELAKRSVGSVVEAAETLVTLVPRDAEIVAQVEIGTRDIGHVTLGDLARIKLDPLPFQHHGTLTGLVRTISDDALASAHDGGGDRMRVYQTRIALDPPRLRNVPASFRLLPGMSVSAEVKVGTRTVASYALHPLLQVFDESFREP
jgi:HlyD family secretion protein